ncbi:hypothetical protein, partial [Gulbenkiania mobilis]|uniref:hypothetical protein n=1 Tax=Gulbenkiania mobilis TaxID=397457 RepID=UPI001F33F607
IVFLTEEQKRDVEEDYGKDKRFVVVPHAVTLDKDEILDESIERNPKSAITRSLGGQQKYRGRNSSFPYCSRYY